MPNINLDNQELRILIQGLKDVGANDPDGGGVHARLIAKKLEEHLLRDVTVICRENHGTPDCLLYTVTVKGLITKEKITDLVREVRTDELGDEPAMQVWLDRLEPLVVLDGDVTQLADFRS